MLRQSGRLREVTAGHHGLTTSGCIRKLGATIRTREERPNTSDPTGKPRPFSQRPPKSTISPRLPTTQAADLFYVPQWTHGPGCDQVPNCRACDQVAGTCERARLEASWRYVRHVWPYFNLQP